MFMAPAGPSFVMVSEDPERTWAQIGEHAVYDAGSYATWQTGDHDNVVDMGGEVTVESLRGSGMWEVVTPEECLELGRTHGSVALHPLMGGMPPELGWESLELFVDRVLPRF
jgi:hypothetical protein